MGTNIRDTKSLKQHLDRCVRSMKKCTAECDAIYGAEFPTELGSLRRAVCSLRASLDGLKDNIESIVGYTVQLGDAINVCDNESTRGQLNELNMHMLDYIDEYRKVQKRNEEHAKHLNDAIATITARDNPEHSLDTITEALRILRTETAPHAPDQPQIKLPKISLPTFDGTDSSEFLSYWNLYEKTIHINPHLSGCAKMQYFASSLTGPAKSLIANMTISDDNYPIAVSKVKACYASPQKLSVAIRSKLMLLAPVPNETAPLRQFYTEVTSSVETLRNLIPDEDSERYTDIVLAKLPVDLIVTMENVRGDEVPWTMASLCASLLRNIKQREVAECRYQTANSQVPVELPTPTMGGMMAPVQTQKADRNGKKRVRRGRKPEGDAQNPSSPPDSRQDAGSQQGQSAPQPKRVRNRKCPFCGDQGHFGDHCSAFPTIQTRTQRIQDRCQRCFRKNHRMQDCWHRNRTCFHCSATGHHSALCPEHERYRLTHGGPGPSVHMNAQVHTPTPGIPQAWTGIASDNHGFQQSPPPNLPAPQFHGVAGHSQVMLQTVNVKVGADRQATRTTRVAGLMDNGSSGSYITDRLAACLGLTVSPTDETVEVDRFMSSESVRVPVKRTTLALHRVDHQPLQINVSVIPMITRKIVKAPVPIETWTKKTQGLRLADNYPVTGEAVTIDLLIGNDIYADLTTGDRVELNDGLYLINTHFGWVLSGRMTQQTKEPKNQSRGEISLFAQVGCEGGIQEDLEGSMNLSMENFWALETIGIKDDPAVTEDEEANLQFQRSISQTNGRYSVDLPKKANVTELPSSYGLSYGRLNGLMRSMKRKPKLWEKYCKVFDEQITLGILEDAPDPPPGRIVNHIPHHAVEKPTSSTTKVRPVFDASARTSPRKLSLNDCLLRGPINMENLVGILLRFRLHRHGMTSDVERAFHQIEVNQEDRDLMRFVWLKDPMKPLSPSNVRILRFTRVPFGLKCSPYLLNATIVYHLEKYKDDPQAVKMKQDIYVDNIVTGAETTQELMQLYKSGKSIFSHAQMNLREFVTNNAEVMQMIPDDDKGPSEENRILGVVWNPMKDTLRTFDVDFSKVNPQKMTKRNIWSVMSKVYDPSGMFSPVIIKARALMQDVCRKRIHWDDQIQLKDKEQVPDILENLSKIQTVAVPRFIGSPGNGTLFICFTDASKMACATAVYMRLFKDSKPATALIYSKSRLAPLKTTVTMPRLELIAVLMGIRALKFVQRYTGIQRPCILFSDSQIVLHWLKSQKPLATFVQNRVKEILTMRTTTSFKYVNTSENPADLASRGTGVKDLTSLWWHGPAWLNNEPTTWPSWEYDDRSAALQEAAAVEERKTQTTLLLQEPATQVSSPCLIDETRYSSFLKLLRVTAYCTRFVNNYRKNRKIPGHLHIHATELAESRMKWDRFIQQRHFGAVLDAIHNKRKHPLIQQLGLKLHEDDWILRSHNRLAKAPLTEEAKFPVVLPTKSHYTALIIKHTHERSCHTGTEQTLSNVRNVYWILRGRTAVQGVVRACKSCKRHTGGTFQLPKMPDLPGARVTPERPFSSIGLDYFGPLYVTDQGKQRKVWVALMTCLTIRAVHLEIAQDLSGEQFAYAFRRFMARRGAPRHVVSDNGPQFRLLETFLAGEGQLIRWSFIPAFAPWQGGVYERMVQTVKQTLKKSIGRAKLTEPQLHTFLTEAERVVNSRPLVHVSSDSKDPRAITPADFLQLNPQPWVLFPDASAEAWEDPDYVATVSTQTSLRQLWKKGEALLNEFWSLFVDQYVINLRERARWNHPPAKGSRPSEPKVGTVVLVKEGSVPRCRWRIGLITGRRRSEDGHVRAASVKVNTGTIERPINLLVPLEVSDDYASEEDHVPPSTRSNANCEDATQSTRTTRQNNTELNARPPRRQAAVRADKLIHDQQAVAGVSLPAVKESV